MPDKRSGNFQSPERAARFAQVRPVLAKADRIRSALSCQAVYNDPARARYAQTLGARALLLMCYPVHRRRFNRRLRAISQSLNNLEKYIPTE